MIRVGETIQEDLGIPIGQADYPAPFASGLEYSAPARGTWNIVHTGMLIPEAHQIFVCAQGCLRGVVLTAAEMGAQDRFSTVAVRENNVLNGDMESLIIDGVSDVLEKLPVKPPAVLVYTSCIHHFMGTDLETVYRELRDRWPGIRFTDCYMTPIMRKSGLNPDQTMRRQLYSLLDRKPADPYSVTYAGHDFPLDRSSELFGILERNGYKLREAASCRSFSEYLEIASSARCFTTFPAAKAAGQYLEEHFGQKHLYLPFSFDYDEILWCYQTLCSELGIPFPDLSYAIIACEDALHEAREKINGTPIRIDYTLCPRPLGLAKMLLTHGFNVTTVYADSFTPDEKADFEFLKTRYPNLMLYPTVHPGMRILPRKSDGKVLALGQKAAYFSGTDHFVNIVEGAGLYGFDGITQLIEMMTDANLKEKDARSLIQVKGLGCGNGGCL